MKPVAEDAQRVQPRRSARRPQPSPNLNDTLGCLFKAESTVPRKRRRLEEGQAASRHANEGKKESDASDGDGNGDDDDDDGSESDDGVDINEIASNAAYFAKQLGVARVCPASTILRCSSCLRKFTMRV